MGADGSWITEFPYTVVSTTTPGQSVEISTPTALSQYLVQLPLAFLPRNEYYHLEIRSFICSTREILNTSVCNMKSGRHQGNALIGASIKTTNTRYNKCKNPDKSELLTKDLKVATDCTVSGVIFSEFQGAMTRSQKKNVYYYCYCYYFYCRCVCVSVCPSPHSYTTARTRM